MSCKRFQTDGMRFLDGEMNTDERADYQSHVATCDGCAGELKSLGRVVQFTDELRLRPPDEAFWDSYWQGFYRRMERGTGFLFMIMGLVALSLVGIIRAVMSPDFLTFKGLSVTAVLVGLVVLFISVLRERYHESKTDPYKGVRQ